MQQYSEDRACLSLDGMTELSKSLRQGLPAVLTLMSVLLI